LAKAARGLGLENPLVVGQSLGGTVALAWAVEEPTYIRGLVPISPVAMPWTTGIGLYYRLTSHPLIGGVICHIIAAIAWPSKIAHDVAEVFEPQPVPHGYIDQLSVDLGLSAHNSRSNGLVRGTLIENLENLKGRYHEITIPVEVIHGTDDTMVPKELHFEGLRARLSNAEFTLLEGVGHMPHHSHKNDIVDAILRVSARADGE
jgi:pimeloyl-ACP methyl ester carboxylesterase